MTCSTYPGPGPTSRNPVSSRSASRTSEMALSRLLNGGFVDAAPQHQCAPLAAALGRPLIPPTSGIDLEVGVQPGCATNGPSTSARIGNFSTPCTMSCYLNLETGPGANIPRSWSTLRSASNRLFAICQSAQNRSSLTLSNLSSSVYWHSNGGRATC
jgi:hypothetical protein